MNTEVFGGIVNSEHLLNAEYDENGEVVSLDGFMSEDKQHQVVWQEVEVVPNESYEVWWCVTHERLYYGGCI